MGNTLIDYFNNFVELKRRKKFSAGAQAAYFAILAEFNMAHYPEQLFLSTRDLQNLAGLKSVSTALECRNALKNVKLIDFKTQNGVTVYKLLEPNGNRTLTEHQPNSSRTATEQSRDKYNSPKEVTKETKNEKEKENISPTTTIARAGAHVNKENDLDKLVDYWEESRFGRLSIELISKLEIYLKKYGYSEVKAAMDSAKESNGSPYGVSFKYFATILENRKKGVDKRGGSDSIAPSPKPERDKLADPKPWDKYAPAL